MATIQNASLVVKDVNGNVGYHRAPSASDIGKIQNAVNVTTREGLPPYSAAINYEPGFVVRSGTMIYQCLVANGPASSVRAPTDTTYWRPVRGVDIATTAAAGIVRPDGSTITVDGAGGISAADATASAKGVVWLADDAAVSAGTAGRVVDAAQLKAVADAIPTQGQIWAAAMNFSSQSGVEQVIRQHNSSPRGDNLLSGHFAGLTGLSQAVANGDFSDIFIGDWFPVTYTYGGAAYTSIARVAGINSKLHHGDTETTRNHLAMVFDSTITARMNATNVTDGGYVGSEMYTTTLPALLAALGGAPGSPLYGHMLSWRELFSNAISTASGTHAAMHPGSAGWASNWAWYDTSLTLMSEHELYGGTLASSSTWAQGACKQLPLFAVVPEYACHAPGAARYTHWLRSVAASGAFCYAGGGGIANSRGASGVFGVRPLFLFV